MSGFARCLTKISVLAGLVIAVTASSGSAASTRRMSMLGVVRHSSSATVAGPRALQRSAAPVSQAGLLQFDPNYETAINRYFTDVAHDSGGTSNVYSAATQYSDGSGPIQYQSTFGGSYVAHDPLPASGCNDGVNPACLTDNQLRHEIQRVLTANDWHGGNGNVFFLMTPNGVGTCYDSFGAQCSANYFCAYHDSFVDANNEPVIYVNEPYQPAIDACASGSSPNGDSADTTINTISHENNEAITDPFGDGWYANDPPNYDENGDLCAWNFGAALGGFGGTAYNQVINGDHYWLQQEYSNAATGCVQHLGGPSTPVEAGDGTGPLVYHGGQVMHTNTIYAIYWLPTARPVLQKSPHITGHARVGRKLSGSRGSWTFSPTGFHYQWLRCNAHGGSCSTIRHATQAAYTVTRADVGHRLRLRVTATNSAGSKVAVSATSKRVAS
jgi:hypothetical protein